MKLPEPVNKTVHVGLGYWLGEVVNDPKYRWGGIALAVVFIVYQVVEVWTKGDKGYHEIKQFGIGLGIALLIRRLRQWLKEA